jgi:transglutaminase-like putative cysteine protease
MKRYYMLCSIFLAVLLLPMQSLFAQLVDDEYMEMATNFRKKFPDDNAVILNSETLFTFERDKDEDGKPIVTVLESTDAEYIGIKDFSQLFLGDGYNDISDVKLSAKVSKGGKFSSTGIGVQDREYSQENIFDVDSRIKYMILPLSTIGLRYQTNIESSLDDIKYIGGARFNQPFPTEERTIIYEVPDWLKAEIREFNFEGYNVIKTKEYDAKEKVTTYKFVLKNIASVPSEKFTPNLNFCFPHVVFNPKSFTTKEDKKITLFEKVDNLYAWYHSLTKQVKNQPDQLQEQVNKLTAGKTTEEEKIKAIYYWVQDNIKYIAFERGIAGFKPEPACNVFKNKFGDCKGMANLITEMLKLAGFDARLAWIGTNDIPYDYSLPSMIVDNHMICALNWKGKFHYLDGTEKYIALDDYAQRIQDREVLVEDGDNFVVNKIPNLSADRNMFFEKKQLSLIGDILNAKIERKYQGEMQVGIMNYVNDNLAKKNRNEVIQYVLSDGDKNIQVATIPETDFSNREKPIAFIYEATIANKVTPLDAEVYVSIDFSNDLENFLPDDKRKNPIRIEDKIHNEYSTTFQIPNGFSVKTLPKALSIKKDNYQINVTYTQIGTAIQLDKKIIVNNCIIPIAKMAEFKADIKQLKDMNSEQILLGK